MAFYYVAAFICGLVVGSFANVLIYRVPLKKSIVYPASHCPNCGTPIKWYDNIPVASYAVLSGKCRSCGKPISARYPAVELACGLLFAWSAYTYGLGLGGLESVRAVLAAAFTTMLLVLAVIDLDHKILPDVIVLPAMVFGGAVVGAQWIAGVDVLPLVASAQLSPWTSGFARAIFGFVLGGGVLLLIALPWRGKGMGGGDIKLMAMMGLFLGPFVLFDLFVGVFLGSVVGIYLIAVQKKSRKDLLPFGPFLVMGAYITLTWGEQIIMAYLGAIGFS